MANPENNGSNNVIQQNKEEFFDAESSGSGKLWIALLFIAVSAGVILLFWLARGSGTRQETPTKIEATTNDTRNYAEEYEALKQRITKENEISHNDSIEEPEVKEPMEEIIISKNMHEPIRGIERSLNTKQESNVLDRGKFSREPVQPNEMNSGRKDDAVVRLKFIDSLAAWLVTGYMPSPNPDKLGTITVSLQNVNMRYGVELIGLSWVGDDPRIGRNEILNYVFTPAMLDALYRLYCDRFMKAISLELLKARAGMSFTLKQKQDFYRLYARRFRGISGALQGIAVTPNFIKRMDQLKKAAQRVVNTNSKYTDLLYCADKFRDTGNKVELQKFTKKAHAAAKVYQQAVVDRERLTKAMILAIRQNVTARILDDSNLLYLANWVDRRLKNHPENMDAVLQSATIFFDLAKRFEMASGTIQSIN